MAETIRQKVQIRLGKWKCLEDKKRELRILQLAELEYCRKKSPSAEAKQVGIGKVHVQLEVISRVYDTFGVIVYFFFSKRSRRPMSLLSLLPKKKTWKMQQSSWEFTCKYFVMVD